MSFLRRLLGLAFPTCSMGSDASDARGLIAASFRQWAGAHDLRVEQTPGLRVFGRLSLDGPLVRTLPAISAALILAVGLAITARAIPGVL